MQAHPFFESVINRIAGALCVTVGWIVYSTLLYCYGEMEWWMAGIDGLVSIGLLATAGYVYGFIEGTIYSAQIRIAVGLLAQFISLIGAWEVEVWINQATSSDFLSTLPIRLTLSIMAWIILLMWYQIHSLKEPEIEEIEETEETNELKQEMSAVETAHAAEESALDRITIKDGSHIHIIHLEELLYIQSSGDYVTLFTPDGQYVKEQTMKYFETHLPTTTFVRIHRSCIVNMEQILRVELFGKENYQIRLKNNVCLRASLGGYKRLKGCLQL